MDSFLLCHLPDEILHLILFYGSASSATALEQTHSRFRNVTNDQLLWRHYCRNDFRFWDPKHEIRRKFAGPASSVDWKELYGMRQMIDIATTELLDSILACQAGRIEKVRRIIEFGYDAKDTLLRHASAQPDQEDYLTRRYYSNAILGSLHRSMALPVWWRLRRGENVPLHRALGAFDMFILGSGPGDFDDISRYLDQIVDGIVAEQPNIGDLPPRARAKNIAAYLREKNLSGIEYGREYYRIEHSFLGVALKTEGHNSLPLISAAIYCYVAQKLGLDANPCGFPFHVHVIIRPRPGYDLDGNAMEAGKEGEPMYMDPFRSTQETPVSELQSQLNFLGALTLSHSTFLRESQVPEIVLRCAKNILNAMMQAPHYSHTSLDVPSVKYAALWASILFSEYTADQASNDPEVHERRRRPLMRYLSPLTDHFMTHFPLDVHLMENYILGLFEGLPEYPQIAGNLRLMKATDEFPKQVRRRTAEHQNVLYRVGQIFRHRRYGYIATIIGWDAECGAGEDWMQTMGVDNLRAGRHQSFYHVLVEDKSVRYVAQENIEIIHPDISVLPASFVNLAGKYFKRWDRATARFVSNIRDEYPDD